MAKVQKIEESIRIQADPARVWALIQDAKRTPEWNPLLTEVRPRKQQGKGVGGTSDWKAKVAGVAIGGLHEVTEFEPEKSYACRCTHSETGLSVEGRYTLKQAGPTATDVTAVLSFSLPAVMAGLLRITGIQQYLVKSTRSTLVNMRKLVVR